MAGERNNDDIAAALHGLNGGQGPSQPVPPKPAAAKRAPSPVMRPASPVAARSTPAPSTSPQQPRTRPTTPARAATPEPLNYRAPQAAAAAPKPKRRRASTSGFRRTMIPILLTTGFMLFIMAGAQFAVPDDAPLSMLPAWSTAVLVGLGVVLIALAGLNMAMVHHEQVRQQQLQATSEAATPR